MSNKKLKKNNIVNPGGTEDIATFANFNDEEEFDETEVEYDENADLYYRTIASIREGVKSKVLTKEQGTAYEIQALQDYTTLLTQELGYDPEDVGEYLDELEEEEEGELVGAYSSGVDIATFSAGNSFGTVLQQVLANDGYEDLEEGVNDLAKGLGLDAEDTAGLFTGDFVPHPELVDAIAQLLELDENTYYQLHQLGEVARVDAGYEYGDEEEEDEEEESEEASYSRELESRLAEFEFNNELKDAISSLELDARHGVEDGWLPPIVYKELIGSFELEKDQIAAFSAVCEASQVDANTQLYAINYALEAFKRCGPLMTFGAFADEPLDERQAAIATGTRDQASRNFELRKRRG